MPEGERLDRIYHTQDQLLKLMQQQATDNHAVRQDVGEIKDTLIGTLENPGGLAGKLRSLDETSAEHEVRIAALEESRDTFLPVVAAHRERRKDWGTFKGGIIGTAATAFVGWVLFKLTGKAP